MKLYMAVTPDEYELPVMIAETPSKLARMCGVNRCSVSNAISRRKRGRQSRKSQKMTKCWFVTVEVDDEDG